MFCRCKPPNLDSSSTFPILDEAKFFKQLKATYDTVMPSKDPT